VRGLLVRLVVYDGGRYSLFEYICMSRVVCIVCMMDGSRDWIVFVDYKEC